MNPEENNPFAGAANPSDANGGDNMGFEMVGLSGYSDNGATMADSMASAEDNLTAAGLASSTPSHVMGLEQIAETDPNPNFTSSEVDDKPLVPAAPVPGSIGSVTSVPADPPLAPNLDMPVPPSSNAMPNLAPAPSSTAGGSTPSAGSFTATANPNTNYGAPGSNTIEAGNNMPVMSSPTSGVTSNPALNPAPTPAANPAPTEPKLPGVAPTQPSTSGIAPNSQATAGGATNANSSGQAAGQSQDALAAMVAAPTPFSATNSQPMTPGVAPNVARTEASRGVGSSQKFKRIVIILVGVIAVLLVSLIVMVILYIGALDGNKQEVVYISSNSAESNTQDPIGGTDDPGATAQVSNLSCTANIDSERLSDAWYGALNGTRTLAMSFVDGNLAGVNDTIKLSYDSNEMAEIAKTELGIDRAAYLEQNGLAEEPFLRSYEVVNNDLTIKTDTTEPTQITTQNAGTFGLAVENDAVVTAYDPIKASYEAAGFVCTVE